MLFVQGRLKKGQLDNKSHMLCCLPSPQKMTMAVDAEVTGRLSGTHSDEVEM